MSERGLHRDRHVPFVLLVLAAVWLGVAGYLFHEGLIARRLVAGNAHATGIVVRAGPAETFFGRRSRIPNCTVCMRVDEGPAFTGRTCLDSSRLCAAHPGDALDLLYDPDDPRVVLQAESARSRADVWYVAPLLLLVLASLCAAGAFAFRDRPPRDAPGP